MPPATADPDAHPLLSPAETVAYAEDRAADYLPWAAGVAAKGEAMSVYSDTGAWLQAIDDRDGDELFFLAPTTADVASEESFARALLATVRVRVDGPPGASWYGTLAPWTDVEDAADLAERCAGSVPVRAEVSGRVVVVAESCVTRLDPA